MPLKESEVLAVPENNIQNRWISLQAVCDIWRKRHTVMRWIDQRGMPASKVGKLWRFKTADIDEWIKKGGASDEREVIK
jgi:excisionase family DNA binding protein